MERWKRLNDEELVFSVEGPAELLTDSPDGTLTQPVKWGSAPALVRLGAKPGTVTVRASREASRLSETRFRRLEV